MTANKHICELLAGAAPADQPTFITAEEITPERIAQAIAILDDLARDQRLQAQEMDRHGYR